ncbi:uncharacterized protein M421DRAFT_342404 [Didymella exigua CBS 183.55]|uniref:Transcription factor domain-containing protein n=1 Tax=Didymella exigua CBS 183.55 TaxID=1150837 RepID=A0A6A5RS76_9PLEO|nr:uncharacterized protein M421DRAFT_342404 [Didymella exigua CBS 183.55]KAF1931235.1 hypothetical protein M421DRAFT_342404 [Didymella exigua CBS 183.55]
MRAICADQMSFLSHVSVSSVYQDLADGLWQDSGTTVRIKTHALSTIAGQLESNDATILSILHLLLSEVGGDETAFSVHYRGLQGLIHKRGGLSQLTYHLATYVVLHLTTLAMLKRLPELAPHPTSNLTLRHTRQSYPCASPLYALHGEFTSLGNSCSTQTLEIIIDMSNLTQAFTHQHQGVTNFVPTPQYHEIYSHLHRSPSAQDIDWIHESTRLAALIYTHAIIHHTTFTSAANISHQDPTMGNTTVLHALLSAVDHTDAIGCWGSMRGVFLWVCLIGGAASWGSDNPEVGFVSPQMAWMRKCFSFWAIRAVVGVGFEFADGTMEGLRMGLRIRNLLDERNL